MITICGEGLVDLVAVGEPGRAPRVFHAHPGGSSFNVAVGAARLGHDVSLLARLGHDPFGHLLRDHLRANGVSDRDLAAATEPSSLAVVALDGAGRATYDFRIEGTADWGWRPGDLPDPLSPDVTALHTGSLACQIQPGADAIEAMLRRERDRGAVTLSYDPNIRPTLAGGRASAVTRVERLVGLVDLVKVSDEDLAWLYPGADPARVATGWARSGPRLVVVTLGPGGAIAVTAAGTRCAQPAYPVRVVDTVGAGDAFTAGMLTGLADIDALGRDLTDLDTPALAAILDHAGRVAALTCARPGADPPTRAELTDG